MSAALFAIFAILSIAFGVWMLLVSRNPKHWRLRWLDLFGILDTDTTRQKRQTQEAQLRFMALVLFVLLTAMSISCIYWSAWQLRESWRPRNSVERELELLRKQADLVRRR